MYEFPTEYITLFAKHLFKLCSYFLGYKPNGDLPVIFNF